MKIYLLFVTVASVSGYADGFAFTLYYGHVENHHGDCICSR